MEETTRQAGGSVTCTRQNRLYSKGSDNGGEGSCRPTSGRVPEETQTLLGGDVGVHVLTAALWTAAKLCGSLVSVEGGWTGRRRSVDTVDGGSARAGNGLSPLRPWGRTRRVLC